MKTAYKLLKEREKFLAELANAKLLAFETGKKKLKKKIRRIKKKKK